MKEISVSELKTIIDSGKSYQLIDVREPYEADICAIGGQLIPMGEVMSRLDEIRKDVPVYVHCRSGKRSAAIVQALETQGYSDVANVAGGILAWADEIDPSMPKY